MPAPVMAQARGQSKPAKRSQDLQQQQPPAKRPKLSKPQPSPQKKKGLAAVVIPRAKEGKKIVQAASNGFKDDIRLHRVDESAATIATGQTIQDVDMEDERRLNDEDSSEVGDSEYDSDEGEPNTMNGEKETKKEKGTKTNGAVHTESSEDDASEEKTKESDGDEQEDDGEKEAPSFGELLLASGAADEPIDVEAALVDSAAAGKLATAPQRALTLPSGASLTTLLTQALRTQDKDLLETCLQTTDLDIIRSTIERLDSALVVTLLHRVAERLHKRPGRAAMLMVWVQWTLVAHGGHLVSQPTIVRKIGELYRVICERATSLPWLLQLKGKLDMLSAQLELRRNMEHRPEIGTNDDEAIIYVEGEESDSEDEAKALPRGSGTVASRNRREEVDDDDLADEDADDGIDMPLGAYDDEDEELDSDENGMLDGEAEETDRDTGDERSEVESEDDEEGESIDESDDEEGEDERPIRRSTAVQRPSKKAF